MNKNAHMGNEPIWPAISNLCQKRDFYQAIDTLTLKTLHITMKNYGSMVCHILTILPDFPVILKRTLQNYSKIFSSERVNILCYFDIVPLKPNGCEIRLRKSYKYFIVFHKRLKVIQDHNN